MSNPSTPPKPNSENDSRTDQPPGGTTLPVPVTLPSNSPSVAPTDDLGLPETFGRYRILKQLGKGGMGTVYLAHDTQIDRDVALKVPHANIAEDAQSLDRFYREARAAGRLQHPNLCPIYDVGEIDGIHFLTMAFIEGQPLAYLAAEFVGQSVRAAELMHTIALAMSEAHDKGVIHRDLKPANIMIDQRGEPVVMDFGLARKTDADAAGRTSQGVILGTPHYMSPEQAVGDTQAIGPASDVYSLGVILYELLTGRVPFHGTVTAVLVQIVHSEPPPPSSLCPGLDPRLEAVCLKAMAKDFATRYPSMEQFADALSAYLDGSNTPPAAQTSAAAAGLTTQLATLAEETLSLFRRWGWQRTLDLLRERYPNMEQLPRAVANYLGWIGGDAAREAEARVSLRELKVLPDLAAWAVLGQVYRTLQAYELGPVSALLDSVASQGAGPDPVLEANLAHLRGFVLFRRGQRDQAVPLLLQALTLLGRNHFLTGRLLDTLGQVYAGLNNFHAAREFHDQAILCKQQFDDEAGIAYSHGRLGQLYLEFDQFDEAEEHLNADLQMIQQTAPAFIQAEIFEYLGQMALERGKKEAAGGRQSAALNLWTQAAEWLDWSAVQHGASGKPVLEGRALKGLAEVDVCRGDFAAAETRLQRAELLLKDSSYPKTLVEVHRVRGLLRRAQGQYPEALKALQLALTEWDAVREHASAARTQLELARTLRASKAMPRLVTQAFVDALQRAETCRRVELVKTVEEELKWVDQESHWRHAYRRVRGALTPADTSSLSTGSSEPASVLFLNLQGFMKFCQGMDPGEVMQTLNQLLADQETVLVRYKAQVTAYLGGGFMALLLGANHAERAVDAALDLFRVVAEFNRPREVLDLGLLPVRIGVASGPVCIGNIGTYRKMDFTAIGPAVNLASRLVRQGADASPCISNETYDLVQTRFLFKPEGARTVDLKGIGVRQVWDVIGRTKERSSGVSRG